MRAESGHGWDEHLVSLIEELSRDTLGAAYEKLQAFCCWFVRAHFRQSLSDDDCLEVAHDAFAFSLRTLNDYLLPAATRAQFLVRALERYRQRKRRYNARRRGIEEYNENPARISAQESQQAAVFAREHLSALL